MNLVSYFTDLELAAISSVVMLGIVSKMIAVFGGMASAAIASKVLVPAYMSSYSFFDFIDYSRFDGIAYYGSAAAYYALYVLAGAACFGVLTTVCSVSNLIVRAQLRHAIRMITPRIARV